MIFNNPIKIPVPFDFNSLLILQPENLRNDYLCKVTFIDNGNETVVSYLLNICCDQILRTGNFVFKINRDPEKVFINGKNPGLIVEEIAIMAGNVIYPLELEIENNGSMKNILNFTEIKKRWGSLKNKELACFQGDLVEKYLNQMEDVLKAEDSLLKKINKDWVLSSYFTPIYLNWQSSKVLKIPILDPLDNLPYNASSVINPHLSSSGDILLQLKGELDTETCMQSYPYLSNNGNDSRILSGSLTAVYMLDFDTKTIFLIDNEYSLDWKGQKKVKVEIIRPRTQTEIEKRRTQLEILRTKKSKESTIPSFIVSEDENTDISRKKRTWSILD